MTPEQVDLVRSSYAALGDQRRAVARDFYRRLFAADPAVEELFGYDADVMAVKFSDELAAIVEAIVSFDAFASRLRDLAARHVGYGVQTRHYRLVGDAARRGPRRGAGAALGRGARRRVAHRLQPGGRGDDGRGRPGEVQLPGHATSRSMRTPSMTTPSGMTSSNCSTSRKPNAR